MITINGFMPDKINFPDGTMKLDIPLIMEDSINFTKKANFTWKFASETEVLELMYMSGQGEAFYLFGIFHNRSGKNVGRNA